MTAVFADAPCDPFWGTAVPCAGKWALFDSLRADHHREAAAICATCPIAQVAACRTHLENTQQAARSGGPQGTWAGQLVGVTKRPVVIREHGTNKGYGQHRHYGETACDACKAAHAANWHETQRAVA